MRCTSGKRVFIFRTAGGCLLAVSLLLSSFPAGADTVVFKNKNRLVGLVVEQHQDRVIVSTAQGELPVFRKDIAEIQFDSEFQNYLAMAREYEKQGKLGLALDYYNKTLEANPDCEPARKAIVGVQNRFWAASTEGPRDQVEKYQAIHDSWDQGRSVDDVIQEKAIRQLKLLREGLGLVPAKKGDWVVAEFVDSKKPAGLGGLRRNDRLVSIDGQSLRYLSVDVVAQQLLLPAYTDFTLEYERDCYVHVPEGSGRLKDLGLDIRLENRGLVVKSVKKETPAARAGLLPKDLVTKINGEATRYMPLARARQLIETAGTERVIITVRRTGVWTRR